LVADAKLATPQTMNQLFLFTALLQEPARALELGATSAGLLHCSQQSNSTAVQSREKSAGRVTFVAARALFT
jgi:hypothetical protein